MNTLISVQPTGFFSYGWHHTVQLDGLGAILLDGKNHDRHGGSNASGKTSLFNTIAQILYGKNPSEEVGEKVINTVLGRSFGRIIFTDKNLTKWRVTDVKKWKKTDPTPDVKVSKLQEEPSEWINLGNKYSGTDVFLERWDQTNNIWVDERATNSESGETRLELKSTRKKIVDILSMDYEQFMAVAYMAQEKTLKFINGTHKEKMEVLSGISDIKIWDKRTAKIRDDLKILRSESDRLQSKLDGLIAAEGSVTKPDMIDVNEILSSIDNISLQINDVESKISTFRSTKTTNQTLISELELSISDMVTQIRKTTIDRSTQESYIRSLKSDYSKEYNSILSRPLPPELASLQIEISQINGIIIARRHDLEQLLVGEGKCPRCRSVVTIQHILRHRELLELEIQEQEDKKVDINTKISSIKYGIDKQTNDMIQASKAKHDILINLESSKLDAIDSSLTSLNNKLQDLKSKKLVLESSDNDSKIHTLESQRMTLLSMKSQKMNRINEIDSIKAKYDAYIQSRVEAELNLNNTNKQIKYLEVTERLFGDKGIKAFKLDKILNLLNYTVQQYMDIITDENVKVSVSQYREKSDGDITTDMQILVSEGTKTTVPYKLYSGGERRQIALAFVGAFWHIASLSGVGVNILCMDETFGPLDAENSEFAFKYIDHLKNSGKSTIFIVSHDSTIKNKVGINQTWTIVKRNHTSTVTYDD